MNAPLTSIIRREGYEYTLTIEELDKQAIINATNAFNNACQKGFIEADSFFSNVWVIVDETHPPRRLSFTINEIHFVKVCAPLLGCTLKDYTTAMRVTTTCYFGASVWYLQNLVHKLCALADNITDDQFLNLDFDGHENAILKFLNLLPGETDAKNDLYEYIEDQAHERAKNQGSVCETSRPLCYYQTYLRFDHVIKDFWAHASDDEKNLYFPIWFWWNISAILPLRPKELVFTPRNCIKEIDGKFFITVRRSKLKGKLFSCKYTIADDFEKCEYTIPESLAKEIVAYIEQTSGNYFSTTDTLFCKETERKLLSARTERNNYYYRDLSTLLSMFYFEVVLSRYQYHLRERACYPLNMHEIEYIRLGDTRHIAMISLMISGNSELICQALAGHDLIETGQGYYGNVKPFIDALVWERVIVEEDIEHPLPTCVTSIERIKIKDGYCFSSQVSKGIFSDCECAISADGKIGDCRSCQFFVAPTGKKIKNSTDEGSDSQLRKTFIAILDAIGKTAKSAARPVDVDIAVAVFTAEVSHYVNKQVLKEKMKKEDIDGA